MQKIVERMMQRCIQDREFKQAIGIALEARRLDIIESVFSSAENDADLLSYVLEAVMTLATTLEVRNKVLRLLVDRFSALAKPDYFSITQCFVYLNDPIPASDLLKSLLSSKKAGNESVLIAYQVAFDLADTATQEFLQLVRDNLGSAAPADQEATESDTNLEQVRRILTGEESIKLYLEFLSRNNHADLLILKTTKEALEARNSVFHSAVSFANAFAHAGTTSDKFIRENLDWLGKAANWSKFTATAGLGVIHKGNLTQGMAILQPYLPADPAAGQPINASAAFSEGGSLYALGLIHANHGGVVLDYLQGALKAAQNETVQHGASLGLGVAGMATGNEGAFQNLFEFNG